MKALKKLPLEIKEKIRQYAKNGVDVSALIDGYSLKGEDLSYCVIKNIQRVDEDLAGVNFSNAKIGTEGKTSYFIRCIVNNSNFDSVVFIGTVWVRSCEVRNCNFRKGYLASVDYRNSDFRNSTFCDTIMRIGTSEGIGCKFSKEFFEALIPGWSIEIIAKERKDQGEVTPQ